MITLTELRKKTKKGPCVNCDCDTCSCGMQKEDTDLLDKEAARVQKEKDAAAKRNLINSKANKNNALARPLGTPVASIGVAQMEETELAEGPSGYKPMKTKKKFGDLAGALGRQGYNVNKAHDDAVAWDKKMKQNLADVKARYATPKTEETELDEEVDHEAELEKQKAIIAHHDDAMGAIESKIGSKAAAKHPKFIEHMNAFNAAIDQHNIHHQALMDAGKLDKNGKPTALAASYEPKGEQIDEIRDLAFRAALAAKNKAAAVGPASANPETRQKQYDTWTKAKNQEKKFADYGMKKLSASYEPEGDQIDEAKRKSAASLGFISTNAGHGVTASSEPYGDKHLPVVTNSSGKRVDVGHNPYPTPELAHQGAEEFIKNTYTRQGVDPVRGFKALSKHHQTHGMQKANEEVEQVDEVITKSTSVGQIIHDFRGSKKKQFQGKSAEKKREMAIAAHYALQRKGK